MFDLKVHHKDKKGRLYKITPYRRIESQTEGVIYERNGMRYNEAGECIGICQEVPRSLQSFEIHLETQGMNQRAVYTRIPNEDAPRHLLSVADSKKVDAKIAAEAAAAKGPELVGNILEEPKRRPGRPRKVTNE